MHWERLDHDCHNENAFRRLRVLAAGADNLRVPFLQGGKNGQGPNLWGLIGRSSGSVDGFAYSAANKNSGITWSAKHLEVYLQDPKKVTPRPRRAFVVLRLSFMWVPWDARGFHGRQGQQQALLRGILLLIRIKNELMRGSRLELQKGARVCVSDGRSCIYTVHAWHQDGLRRPQEGRRPCQPDRLPEEQGLSVDRRVPGRAWHCAQWHTVKQGWCGRKQIH